MLVFLERMVLDVLIFKRPLSGARQVTVLNTRLEYGGGVREKMGYWYFQEN